MSFNRRKLHPDNDEEWKGRGMNKTYSSGPYIRPKVEILNKLNLVKNRVERLIMSSKSLNK